MIAVSKAEGTSRRQFLLGVSTLSVCAFLKPGVALAQQPRTRIILLGTKGGPTLTTRTGRSNASTLLLINDIPYVIDCGYGVSRQLINTGVSLDRLRYIFITHEHSDHDLEYGALFYNAWTTRQSPRVDAYGPVGLRRMTRHFFNYMKFDIDTRIVDEGIGDPRKLLTVHEFNRSGLVMQNQDVKVTSLRVRHPPITQSYAFRFDAKDRSVVISGDTAYAKGRSVVIGPKGRNVIAQGNALGTARKHSSLSPAGAKGRGTQILFRLSGLRDFFLSISQAVGLGFHLARRWRIYSTNKPLGIFNPFPLVPLKADLEPELKLSRIESQRRSRSASRLIRRCC